MFSICINDHPPGKSRKIKWIDCDDCNKWAHEVCAFDSSWQNIRKISWLCDKDKQLDFVKEKAYEKSYYYLEHYMNYVFVSVYVEGEFRTRQVYK